MISPKNDDSMNSTFGHRDAVDLQTATLHLNATDAAARGIQRGRPGARVQRSRRLRAGGAGGRHASARAWFARPSVRWGKRSPGQAQRERADVATADGCRRRADIL